MSGTSYNAVCPRCNSTNLICSSDWKPFDSVSGECLDCGFVAGQAEIETDEF